MPEPDLSGKRVLVLGAETQIGAAVAAALAEAHPHLALVAARNDANAAYAVQRLSRRLTAPGRRMLHQAIDAANEMAARVMVRQVGKDLGGLDAAVFCADVGDETSAALAFALRFAVREMERARGGVFVIASPAAGLHAVVPVGHSRVRLIEAAGPPEDIAREVVTAVAGTSDSG